MIRVFVLLLLAVGPWFVAGGLVWQAETQRQAGHRHRSGALVGAAVFVLTLWASWLFSAPVVKDGMSAPLFGGWW